jgi:hypothetical protein
VVWVSINSNFSKGRGKVFVKAWVLPMCLFTLSASTSLAELRNGDFNYDRDAADVNKFLEDFRRSQYYNHCPVYGGKLV